MENNKNEPKKLILDKEGYEKFIKDIKEVEEKLLEIRLYKGTEAIYQGDNWHDNPALYQAESEERSLMLKLHEMKEQSENVEIVEKSENFDVVQIGDVLLLNMIFALNDSEEMIIKLVGRVGKINAEISEVSVESPLGKAIYEKRVSDSVSYIVNDKQFNVDIVKKIDLEKN